MSKVEGAERIFDFLEGKNLIIKRMRDEKIVELAGLDDSSLAFQIFGLVCIGERETPPIIEKQPVFVLLKDENEAGKLYNNILFWKNLTKKIFSVDYEISTKTLCHLLHSHLGLYIFSLKSFKPSIPPPSYFKNSILTLPDEQKNCSTPFKKTKNKISPFLKDRTKEEIVKKILSLGYEQEKKTILPGTLSWRGGILDVFSPQNDFPYRLEFFGDEIENISFFDPKTNKTIKNRESAQIIPARLLPGKSSITDYLPSSAPQEKMLVVFYEDIDDLPDFKTKDNLKRSIEKFCQIKISPFLTSRNQILLSYKAAPHFERRFSLFQKEIRWRQKKNWQIFVSSSKSDKIEKVLSDNKNIQFFPFSHDSKISGFQDAKTKFIFLTDHEIFGKIGALKKQKKIDHLFLSKIKNGDFVVHLDHGIGRFNGMKTLLIDGMKKEFFLLEYADGDKLFLPVESADKISKYIGLASPPIHRLHGVAWNQVKKRVKEKAREISKELLDLYAKREISSGFVFSKDSEAQKELEESFEYEETEDQLKVMEEVKKDMEGNSDDQQDRSWPIKDLERNLIKKPVDRLICGDVGFGKTEIALRAAFKATFDKKQVAVLCPTTILAQQHFDTFSARLSNFPIKIDVLSRFKNKKEQKEIIKKISNGDLDIVIGTHRILSSDVKFKDLGLLILDEEQRFGVRQKEKIKKLRENVDALTLSATPIPRTLHLALSGLRDISLLQTAPSGRLPVETFILPYDEKIVVSAINEERSRHGQVYFLHNKVQTIDQWILKLKKLLPVVKFEKAHGQMNESKLAKIMSDFYQNKFDVLVCSSIIENGLDLPNVNTLIVDNATRFGLADLYQLRGRVGRGDKKARAYFFYQSQNLKEKAQKRLKALLEAKELGSGFEIAMKDLEIRGAGNVLGKEQSGNIEAVGLSLYCRLLNQAIKEIKTGKKAEEEVDVTIDLPLCAFIPKDFQPSENERLLLYQKMANIYEIKELHKFKEALFYGDRDSVRRSGLRKSMPKELLNLFEILEIKILARLAKVTAIDSQIITPHNEKEFHRLILKSKKQISPKAAAVILEKMPAAKILDFCLKLKLEDLGTNWLKKLKEILRILKYEASPASKLAGVEHDE